MKTKTLLMAATGLYLLLSTVLIAANKLKDLRQTAAEGDLKPKVESVVVTSDDQPLFTVPPLAGEQIAREAIAAGHTDVSSLSYALLGTLGQEFVGEATSPSFSLGGGFWAGGGAAFGPDFLCGDANADELVNITDAVYLIQYIFNGGDPPLPVEAGDANCDEITNITDAVYLIQYIFNGGAAPCEVCP